MALTGWPCDSPVHASAGVRVAPAAGSRQNAPNQPSTRNPSCRALFCCTGVTGCVASLIREPSNVSQQLPSCPFYWQRRHSRTAARTSRSSSKLLLRRKTGAPASGAPTTEHQEEAWQANRRKASELKRRDQRIPRRNRLRLTRRRLQVQLISATGQASSWRRPAKGPKPAMSSAAL